MKLPHSVMARRRQKSKTFFPVSMVRAQICFNGTTCSSSKEQHRVAPVPAEVPINNDATVNEDTCVYEEACKGAKMVL